MEAEHKISYGLYVITVNDGVKDSGCICNTVVQVTTSPKRITLALNKTNYTTEIIQKTGQFNVSILSQDAKFSVFQRFGFQSGRDADKFSGFDGAKRAENGLLYVTVGTNAFLGASVVQTVDLGSHLLFVADVTESGVLSDTPSATYEYYHAHIKQKPQPKTSEGTVWRCKICGYEYKGETLPPDFVCPVCKHGAEEFEKVE